MRSLNVLLLASGLFGLASGDKVIHSSSLRQSIQEELATSSGTPVGVTFSGGGFRALAIHSGVVAGLLGRIDESDPQKALEKLFSRVDAVGSNSGGSWFSGQLFFSKNFAKMLSDIGSAAAKDKFDAGKVYNDRWIQPFLTDIKKAITPPAPLKLDTAQLTTLNSAYDILIMLLKALHIASEWIPLLQVFASQKALSWREFVDHILQVPGDINAADAMDSSNVSPWAKGKVWAVSGAIVSPWEKDKAFGHHFSKCHTETQQIFNATSVVYNLRNDVDKHDKVFTWPISFNTILGGTDEKPPIPFIYGDANIYATYRTMSVPANSAYDGIIGTEMNRVEQAAPVFKNSPLLQKSNKVSIGDAVSTSSSFLGRVVSLVSILPPQITNFPYFSSVLNQYVLNLPLYISASEQNPSKAFKQGEHLRKDIPLDISCDKLLNKIADGHLLTLADGGYVDNSAVSQLLVDESKTEYVLFQNNDETSFADVVVLFQPIKPVNETFDTPSRVPIFAEKEDWAQSQLIKFPKMKNVPGTKYLVDVQYGTIEGTTIDQPLFGLKAGRKIKLHCIFVHSSVSIGEAEWLKYPTVLGELSATVRLPENDKAAQEIMGWLA